MGKELLTDNQQVMAVLIVASKTAYLPDPEEQKGWHYENYDGVEFFSIAIGPHKLFWTKCIKDIDMEQQEKHEIIARIVRLVKEKCQSIDISEFYLIVHDLDLMSEHGEGVFPESNVKEIGSSLISLIPDRHIYVFQHSPKSNMFNTLIRKNSYANESITHEVVENTLALIKNCHYETSVS